MIVAQFRQTSAELDSLKHCSERVVVLDRDRIELMIVTACAADRHAEKRRAHGLHDFIHAIRAGLANRSGLLPNRGRWHMRSGNEKACCFSHSVLIACDLITHELIVRTIFVESSDDIVAIDPRILPVEI